MDKEEVKELRLKLGLSQQAFAVRVGVGVTTVSRWENGKSIPSPLAVEKLLKMEKRNA